MYGLRIKSMRGKGGMVRDVVFKNNRMKDVETPLVFTSYYEYRPLDVPSAEKQLQPGGFILGNQIWPGPTDRGPAVRPRQDAGHVGNRRRRSDRHRRRPGRHRRRPARKGDRA
jgi:hypothetical protein